MLLALKKLVGAENSFIQIFIWSLFRYPWILLFARCKGFCIPGSLPKRDVKEPVVKKARVRDSNMENRSSGRELRW